MQRDDSYERRIKQLVGGRTIDQQIDCIRREGSHGMPSTQRSALLAGLGIPAPKERAEALVVFGCYLPFSIPLVIRDHIRLLDRLGIDYTYLNKESCCGVPMLRTAPEEEKEKAKTASREFMKANHDIAAQKGAKTIAYCCVGCAYMATGFFGGDDVKHVYFQDLIAEKLRGEALKIAPSTVGYYEGCHRSYRKLAGQADLNWGTYRDVLERVEGLELAPMPDGVCCLEYPDHIVEVAEKRKLKTVLCSCNGCYGRIKTAAKGRVEVKYVTDVLLEALGDGCRPT